MTFLELINASIANQKSLNIDINFKENIKEFPSKVACYLYITKSATRRMTVFEAQIDLCSLLDTNQNNFLWIISKEMRRSSNFPQKCPLLKDTLYSIKNYTLNDESYPAFLPKGNFEFIVQARPNNIGVINLKFSGRIKK
ncbi:uncharacterized protein LOC142232349 [Haematobia irritans]|uniref:uncharacterized protein LOC142232349 n=1 Tax=Haematobia irritans TaxID=7368 RepID=UPI003F50C202